VALARVGRSTRGAAGKDEAKMVSGGSDVQKADVAGTAGSGTNGAGRPAVRAGSEASVGSGWRQDGSSADNGRDMRGGGLAADYRRRFCHRASLVTFRRFGGDTVWCPIETAAYDLEWPVGDLATQLFGSDGMSNGQDNENQAHMAKS